MASKKQKKSLKESIVCLLQDKLEYYVEDSSGKNNIKINYADIVFVIIYNVFAFYNLWKGYGGSANNESPILFAITLILMIRSIFKFQRKKNNFKNEYNAAVQKNKPKFPMFNIPIIVLLLTIIICTIYIGSYLLVNKGSFDALSVYIFSTITYVCFLIVEIFSIVVDLFNCIPSIIKEVRK